MPSPSYSVFARTIAVTVTVTPPSTPDAALRVHCDTIIVPRADDCGGWRIVWNLVTDSLSAARLAKFPLEGGIKPLFGPLYPLAESVRISETQWTAVMDHRCEPKVDSLSYEVYFYLWPDKTLLSTADPKVLGHDPTIVVARDPVEPPRG
jgi:hypothetical protein